MARNSSALSDAPPIRPPSTSGIAKSSRGIAGLDAAAVQDAQAGGDFSILRRHPPADEGVHLLRLLGRRRPPGADGPDRLVGDDGARPGPRRRTARAPHRAAAPTTACVRPASRSASCSPTHRIGIRPARQRRGELARHQRIVFAVQRAPLGMADDHVVAADVLQHRGGHLAGEGALAPRRTRPARRARPALPRSSPPGLVRDRRTAGRPRSSTRSSVTPADDGLEQRRVLGARPVHLPVAGDDLASHVASPRGLRRSQGAR